MATYLTNFYAIVQVNGIWTIHATSASVPYIYTAVQDAIDAVKTTYGNNEYKILQEYSITKTDAPT